MEFSEREGIVKISDFNCKYTRTCVERQSEGIVKSSKNADGFIFKAVGLLPLSRLRPDPDFALTLTSPGPGPLLTSALPKVTRTASSRLHCWGDCHFRALFLGLLQQWGSISSVLGAGILETPPPLATHFLVGPTAHSCVADGRSADEKCST